jgi:hypothetical protein
LTSSFPKREIAQADGKLSEGCYISDSSSKIILLMWLTPAIPTPGNAETVIYESDTHVSIPTAEGDSVYSTSHVVGNVEKSGFALALQNPLNGLPSVFASLIW